MYRKGKLGTFYLDSWTNPVNVCARYWVSHPIAILCEIYSRILTAHYIRWSIFHTHASTIWGVQELKTMGDYIWSMCLGYIQIMPTLCSILSVKVPLTKNYCLKWKGPFWAQYIFFFIIYFSLRVITVRIHHTNLGGWNLFSERKTLSANI